MNIHRIVCRFALSLLVAAAVVGVLAPAVAVAQIRPAIVKNIDEPARVAYHTTLDANCPYTNLCAATFPAVPAGMRLRVTRISVFWRDQNVDAFLVLNVNTMLNPVLIFPVSPQGFAYYGFTYSRSQEVDYYFEAGQSPVLEIGTGGNFDTFYPAKLTVTGYLVDLTK